MPATAEARYRTAELSRQDERMLASSVISHLVDELSSRERTLTTGSLLEPVGRTRTFFSRGIPVTFEYRDVDQPLPRWFDATLQGFADLMTLPPNWDTYGAGPISRLVLRRGLELLDWLMGADTPAPAVVPLSSGGFQLEWHSDGRDLELVISPDEGVRYYHCDAQAGIEEEEPLIAHEARIQELLSEFG
jgi:hypothetical protein